MIDFNHPAKRARLATLMARVLLKVLRGGRPGLRDVMRVTRALRR